MRRALDNVSPSAGPQVEAVRQPVLPAHTAGVHEAGTSPPFLASSETPDLGTRLFTAGRILAPLGPLCPLLGELCVTRWGHGGEETGATLTSSEQVRGQALGREVGASGWGQRLPAEPAGPQPAGWDWHLRLDGKAAVESLKAKIPHGTDVRA